MDFSLNETQVQIKDLSAQIFADFTTQEKLRVLDSSGYFDETLWQQLAEAGLLGTSIPEAFGGMGFDFETLCVLLEEAGRYVAPTPLLPVLVTGVMPLLKYANAELISGEIENLIAGNSTITAALYEQGNRDAANPLTTATPQGDDWVLSGTKVCVAAGMQASCCCCWTTALIDGELGVFFLSFEANGLTKEQQVTTAAEYEAGLVLNKASATLIARGETAQQFVDYAMDMSMAAAAAVATGLCHKMTRISAEYTSERKQFGKPLATFQAVAHKLADCYIDTECLTVVKEQAVALLTETDGNNIEARKAALTAQYWTADALHRISHAAQQVHGGAGIDRDYELFRYCLQAKQVELSFGGASPALAKLGALIAN